LIFDFIIDLTTLFLNLMPLGYGGRSPDGVCGQGGGLGGIRRAL
jgi:hypothetical protein